MPPSVQRIARVIGREQALRLVAAIPRRRTRDRRYPNATRDDLSFYVPKRLPADHLLARVLGKNDAERMVRMFGGEILKPGNCRKIAQSHNSIAIARAIADGIPYGTIAALFGVTRRTIQNHAKRAEVLNAAA